MIRPLPTRQLVVDVVLAALFVVLTGPLQLVTGPSEGAATWYARLAIVPPVVLLFGAALAVRRLSPALSLALTWGAALLQMAGGQVPGLADLAVFGVLYAVAAYGSRRLFWWGLASALVGAVVVPVYLIVAGHIAVPTPGEGIATSLAVLAAAMFALVLSWTVGALVRTAARAQENRLAQERAEAEAVAEQERARIARDMHDVVAHSLAVVVAQADGARYAAHADPEAATAALATIATTARAALADVRLLLTQLRHRQGDGPQPGLADLATLLVRFRDAGLDLRVAPHPEPAGDVPVSVQLAVYRIVQEALTNALRHGAGPVDVALRWRPDRVELVVANPRVPGPRGTGGHGLVGMRERAHLVGGGFAVADGGERFEVRAVLPLGADAAAASEAARAVVARGAA